jgi:adenylate cyclase
MVTVFVTLLGFFEFLELKSLDLRFVLRGPVTPASPIVIVSIDEDSFDELDLSWPWPRALHGKLLALLRQGRAAVVGLDLLFIEPSLRGAEDDRALGEAVARAGNVVLGAVFTEIKEALFTKEDLNPPLPVIRAGALAFGYVNLATDEDAFVRSGEIGRPYQGGVQTSFDRHVYEQAVRAGIPAKPLPAQREVLINYRGPKRTFPVIPYYQVLNGEAKPETFEGKIVLVGATTPTLHDEFPTPFSGLEKMPGVEIHANLLETLLQGIAVSRAPLFLGAALALAAAMLAALVTERMRPIRALALVVAAGAGYAALAFGLFVGVYLWVDLMPVQTALVGGYGATVVVNFVREQREKRRLSRFFSPDVIKEILSHRRESALLGTRRRITILFSDIRGFTSLSEKIPPEQVVEMLREYLTAMTEIIFRYGGTVDKYMGDGIMALYGAPFDQPNHAEQAVRTALEFQERVRVFSDGWEAKLGVRLRNGVGVNTGEVVVGTIGSAQRLEYTAIGDAVNLAARLEGLTKEFLSPIIVSESTYEEVKHLFYARGLGEVQVKGKEIPVKIYAIERAEGRQTPRAVLEAPVTVVDGDVSLTGSLQDLSHTGVAVRELPAEMPVGRMVRLRLAVPGLPDVLVTDGRVVWSHEDRAGFAFVGLSLEDENLLEDLVKRQSSARAS